jgi:hypothetical protein
MPFPISALSLCHNRCRLILKGIALGSPPSFKGKPQMEYSPALRGISQSLLKGFLLFQGNASGGFKVHIALRQVVKPGVGYPLFQQYLLISPESRVSFVKRHRCCSSHT